MAYAQRGGTGAPQPNIGQGGIAGPGTGNPPIPTDGTYANTTGSWMPAGTKVYLYSADAGATDGVVFPEVFIAGATAPSDTRFGWFNTNSGASANPFYAYNQTTSTWSPIATQGSPGTAGADGAGAACLLDSDFTAGAEGATGIYANPATPISFPEGQYVLVNDDTLTPAFYSVTAMNAVAQADPVTAPTLAANTGSGPGAGAVTVGYAWRNAVGSTLLSTTQSITLTGSQYATVTLPTPPIGYTTDVYVSIAANSATLALYTNTSGTSVNITAYGSGAAIPSVNQTQGVLMTREAWGTGTAGSGYVYSTANAALMMITGWGGGGAVGPSGTPRNTTISNGGDGFTAGNFGSSCTINVTAGTGTYFLVDDWLKIWDGTASWYGIVTGTSANSVTATRANVTGDAAQAGSAYNFSDGTDIFWIGAPGAMGDDGAAGVTQSPLSADFTAGAQNATGLTCSVSNPAPFFIGAFCQTSDNSGLPAWYVLTGVSGSTLTMTRLAVNPPGVTVAGSTYSYTTANGALISICGPPGQAGPGGGILIPEILDLTGFVDGVTTSFTLDNFAYGNMGLVYRAGVTVRAADATYGYTFSGTTLTLFTAPQVGDTLVAMFFHT